MRGCVNISLIHLREEAITRINKRQFKEIKSTLMQRTRSSKCVSVLAKTDQTGVHDCSWGFRCSSFSDSYKYSFPIIHMNDQHNAEYLSIIVNCSDLWDIDKAIHILQNTQHSWCTEFLFIRADHADSHVSPRILEKIKMLSKLNLRELFLFFWLLQNWSMSK